MIEQMTHVAVMCGAPDRDALLEWLSGERIFHVMPIDEEDGAWRSRFDQLPDETPALDAEFTRLNSVVAFCQEYCSNKPSFIDAMLPLKVVGTREEIDAAVAEISIDRLAAESADLRALIEEANERISRLTARRSLIEQFAFLGDDLPRLSRLKRVALEVVAVPAQGGRAFLLDERIAGGDIAAEQLFADQSRAYYALAAPESRAGELRALIDEHALYVYPIPEARCGVRQELSIIAAELLEANSILESRRAEANRFADAWLRRASLAAGDYESRKNLAAARLSMAESEHLFVTRGYVKTDRLAGFKQSLEAKIPGSSLLPYEAPDGEEPPTSMKWSRWISPASMVVKMYGLPKYSALDPTPFVASIFFFFVGMCLSDAVYGIGLILIMSWLKKKYADQAGLRDFFQCFTYCGITTLFFGILTGSWMGDLFSIIPGMGWLDRIRTSLQVIDTITDAQLALYIAVGIGVITQLYGLGLKMYQEWRRGDSMSAFSDGFLWMMFLVFAILGGATGYSIFWWLVLLTCAGLILTQGRDQPGLGGKLLVGVISLYGIVGSYGVSAILADLISYARLMALNLTGAALGSTFNLLAGLASDLPIIGIVIAVLVVVLGHTLSFFLNLLGGFVHSARLIMLEFFGRFYDDGGYAFKPYGFDSSMVDVKKDVPLYPEIPEYREY